MILMLVHQADCSRRISIAEKVRKAARGSVVAIRWAHALIPAIRSALNVGQRNGCWHPDADAAMCGSMVESTGLGHPSACCNSSWGCELDNAGIECIAWAHPCMYCKGFTDDNIAHYPHCTLCGQEAEHCCCCERSIEIICTGNTELGNTHMVDCCYCGGGWVDGSCPENVCTPVEEHFAPELPPDDTVFVPTEEDTE